MIKIYNSTLLKWTKCPKILKNKQRNMKLTKIPPKSKKSSVFLLSLRVFWLFSEVLWVLSLFLRFHSYLGHIKSFWGCCHRIGCIFVIFLDFGILWTFVVHFNHFGCSKGSFQRFWCIYPFFDTYVILMSKMIFFKGKIP